MSTTSDEEVIEHVVLFTFHDEEDPTRVNAMVKGIASLNTLPEVLYLTAGPILRTRPNTLKFTHMVHARFRSKSDLSSYAFDPTHLSVINELILPICDDKMGVDWVVESSSISAGSETLHPGRAMRINFFKFKEEGLVGKGQKEKNEVIEGLKRIKKSSELFEQISFGENFEVERGKGFSIGSMVVFHDLNELDACEEYEDSMRGLIEKVKGGIDQTVSVDYVVPRPPSP